MRFHESEQETLSVVRFCTTGSLRAKKQGVFKYQILHAGAISRFQNLKAIDEDVSIFV